MFRESIVSAVDRRSQCRHRQVASGRTRPQALKPGALDVKTKELIAIAIAIAARCDGCVGFHVKAAIKAGATREEVLETVSMAIYMGAGPSMIYAAETLRAFDELTAAGIDA